MHCLGLSNSVSDTSLRIPDQTVIFMDVNTIALWGWFSATWSLLFTDILKFEGEIRTLQGVSVAFDSVSFTEYIISACNKNTKIYTIQDVIN